MTDKAVLIRRERKKDGKPLKKPYKTVFYAKLTEMKVENTPRLQLRRPKL